NIDVGARCIDAISRRDAASLKELAAPDVEVRPLRAVLEDTVYRGRDGVDQWMRDVAETWVELNIEICEISEPEPGYVVARVTLHGRGHESSVPTEARVELRAWVR